MTLHKKEPFLEAYLKITKQLADIHIVYVLEKQLTTSNVVKELTQATSLSKIITEQGDERAPSAVRPNNQSPKS